MRTWGANFGRRFAKFEWYGRSSLSTKSCEAKVTARSENPPSNARFRRWRKARGFPVERSMQRSNKSPRENIFLRSGLSTKWAQRNRLGVRERRGLRTPSVPLLFLSHSLTSCHYDFRVPESHHTPNVSHHRPVEPAGLRNCRPLYGSSAHGL